MNVDAIVTRLGGVSELGQVIAATPGGSISPFDASTQLVSLLSSLVDGNMFALSTRESVGTPSIVFQQVSSITSKVEGYRITESTTFYVFVRHSTYDALVSLVASVITALDGSAYSIEVADIVYDYEEDLETYRCGIEIDFTTLTAAAQTLPAAYVYCISRSAQSSQLDNFIRQLVTNEYGIIVLNSSDSSPVQTMDSLLQAIQTRLLGWQQSTDHHDIEYRAGSSIEGIGGLEIWREVYTDAEYFRES
jgi:hypothetical protein